MFQFPFGYYRRVHRDRVCRAACDRSHRAPALRSAFDRPHVERGIMEVRKIVCACGSGVGCSLILESRVHDTLAKLGRSGVEVSHATSADIKSNPADLYVVGRDLESYLKQVPGESKIVVNDVIDAADLEDKLAEALAR